jgi:hypothetical protein
MGFTVVSGVARPQGVER